MRCSKRSTATSAFSRCVRFHQRFLPSKVIVSNLMSSFFEFPVRAVRARARSDPLPPAPGPRKLGAFGVVQRRIGHAFRRTASPRNFGLCPMMKYFNIPNFVSKKLLVDSPIAICRGVSYMEYAEAAHMGVLFCSHPYFKNPPPHIPRHTLHYQCTFHCQILLSFQCGSHVRAVAQHIGFITCFCCISVSGSTPFYMPFPWIHVVQTFRQFQFPHILYADADTQAVLAIGPCENLSIRNLMEGRKIEIVNTK